MDDMSKCPYCGAAMVAGHLTAAGYRIIWTTDERHFGGLPNGNELLVESLCFTGKMHNSAYHCPGCGKIILTDYPNKNS